MFSLILATILFILGVGLIGGALFGKLRPQRTILLAVGVLIWALAAYLYANTTNHSNKVSPTPVSVVAATATTAATPTPRPTSTPAPTATSTPAPSMGQLVFHSDRGGNLDIWVAEGPDLSEFRQLTTDEQIDVEPHWSPDGSKILFLSGRGTDGVHDLFIMNADGSQQRRLLSWPDSYEWGATWSPDGAYIAFTTTRDYNYEIYVMPADGSADPINLTQNAALDTYANWSPDGRWLVFVSDRGGNWDIWKMDIAACLAARQAGGTDPACEGENLTADNIDDDLYPRWSPDGARIAFESRRNANRDIYIMDADGGNLTQVTTDKSYETYPIWALNGQAIIYSSQDKLNWNLFMVDLASGDTRQITQREGEDRFGDWRP